MRTSKEFKQEIIRRLECYGYKHSYESKLYLLSSSIFITIRVKMEIEYAKQFVDKRGRIEDHVYEDALGWLNTFLPLR